MARPGHPIQRAVRGVGVFLVSGFSLSIGFIESRDRNLLLRFAAGRYFRLTVPVLAACALVHLAIVSGLMNVGPDRHASYLAMFGFDPTLEHLFRFALFDVYFRYEFSQTYLGVLWTMSYELLGSYLLLLVLFISPGRPIAFVLLLAVILVAFFYFYKNAMGVYIPLFFIGALLAQAFSAGWIAKLPRFVPVLALMLGSGLPLFFSSQALPGGIVVGWVTALFVVGCIGTTSVREFLSSPFSHYLGKLSFPLYLVHGPLLHLIGEPALRIFGYSTSRIGFGSCSHLPVLCFRSPDSSS